MEVEYPIKNGDRTYACIYLLFLCPVSCSFFTDPSCNSIEHNKFRDQYKLFLQINPEDDKPVAVVVPRRPCSQKQQLSQSVLQLDLLDWLQSSPYFSTMCMHHYRHTYCV
ncbi:hypothetical protein NC651_025261 [Populus alba x Populus x berolinensis]|nr:hypothetical protein NC651_025261 [Populus alba x Populus x berolinensis]